MEESNRTEIIHKEIDLIQNVITRMANNSFLLKGWMISIIAAVLLLSRDSIIRDITYLSLILYLPVIIFWYLDAFFLHKEKCYRELYNWVIENRHKTDANLYSLNYKRFENNVKNTFCLMFSKTLFPYYGITTIILIGITFYNIWS